MPETTRSYVIRPTSAPPELTGRPWTDADVLTIDQYPWYTAGDKQATELRALYDAENLYLQFRCEDRHISAVRTELNSDVCNDSCVEFFATPRPDLSPAYFNLETNCCGIITLGYSPGRHNRKRVTPELAARITIVTSEGAPPREQRPDDAAWWVAQKLPFEMLAEFTGLDIAPTAGTAWRINAYRCGGKTDPQFACWNWIDSKSHPVPDFHRPEYFGEMTFG